MTPPRKRLHKEVEPENEVKPTAEVASLRRVTRSLTRLEMRVTRSRSNSVTRSGSADVATPPRKKAKKAKAKTKSESTADNVNDEEEGNVESSQVKDDVAGSGSGSGSNTRTIVIEYCKQCNSFKTRAVQVREGLEKAVSGINVLLNPDKPRKGCFEIREDGGETFISLLDMKRPFQLMKDLDMEQVISDIVGKIQA